MWVALIPAVLQLIQTIIANKNKGKVSSAPVDLSELKLALEQHATENSGKVGIAPPEMKAWLQTWLNNFNNSITNPTLKAILTDFDGYLDTVGADQLWDQLFPTKVGVRS